MSQQQHPPKNEKRPLSFEVKKYEPQTCLERYSYMLIRPPRFIYNEAILDPRRKFKNKYKHSVFQVPFPLSLYQPTKMRYVILYLHGNSSSRYEGFAHLAQLPNDVGLACFDFNGCGNRLESGFITLGKKQSEEVDLAVIFLRQKGFKVAVWGRSMGSISALLSKQCEVIVADSPFRSLQAVCQQLSETQVPCACYLCFQCLFPCFFWLVGRDVKQKIHMELSELDIEQHMTRMDPNRHVMFLAAKDDKMINYKHSQFLFNKFKGSNKKIFTFQGSHNSERPHYIVVEMFAFIQNGLFGDQEKAKKQIVSTKMSKKQDESDNMDIGSFSVLKDQKGERISIDIKLSSKVEISSKIVEGGQSEKVEPYNQSQDNKADV